MATCKQNWKVKWKVTRDFNAYQNTGPEFENSSQIICWKERKEINRPLFSQVRMPNLQCHPEISVFSCCKKTKIFVRTLYVNLFKQSTVYWTKIMSILKRYCSCSYHGRVSKWRNSKMFRMAGAYFGSMDFTSSLSGIRILIQKNYFCFCTSVCLAWFYLAFMPDLAKHGSFYDV